MENREISEGNVSRYCKPSKLRKNSRKPFPAAFELRDGEKYLSVFWLEHFGKDHEVENVKAVKEYIENRRMLSLKKSGCFAALNIGHTKQQVKYAYQNIFFRAKNLPHCGIIFDGDDLTISKILANCVHKVYSVKDLEAE